MESGVMKRKTGFLAMLVFVAASFAACTDFPIDPWPGDPGNPGDTVIVDPWPGDTLNNGGGGWGGGGCGGGGGRDTVVKWPGDTLNGGGGPLPTDSLGTGRRH
jgi:hypothetical protein